MDKDESLAGIYLKVLLRSMFKSLRLEGNEKGRLGCLMWSIFAFML